MRIAIPFAILLLAVVPTASAYLLDVEILPVDPSVKDQVVARITGGFTHRDRLLGHRVVRSGRDVRVYVIVTHHPPGWIDLPVGYELEAELGTFDAGLHELCVCEPYGAWVDPEDDPDPDDGLGWVTFPSVDPCTTDLDPELHRLMVRRVAFTVHDRSHAAATWSAVKGLYR